MRLLTLNIRFGAGGASPEKPGYDLPIDAGKLAALADAIRAMRPDVAALQEVYNATQAQRLADVLRMRVVYARHPSSYSLDFFEWGLAFLHDSETIRTHLHSIDFDMERRAGRSRVDRHVGSRWQSGHLSQRPPCSRTHKPSDSGHVVSD